MYVPVCAHSGFFLAEPDSVPYFPPLRSALDAADPRGLVAASQAEFACAWQMLELLLQLLEDNHERRELPLPGLYGLLAAVQQHVGAGQRCLGEWRAQAGVEGC